VSDAFGDGEGGHGDGGFEGVGAVVEAGKEMVVDVYHCKRKGNTASERGR
jgi:hypothetical protein